MENTIERKREMTLTPLIGFNPLIVALKHGHINVAKLLVESGADACAKRVNNRDALESAEAYGESGFTNWYKESGYANCISNGGK